jgi:hypothetical protein
MIDLSKLHILILHKRLNPKSRFGFAGFCPYSALLSVEKVQREKHRRTEAAA